MRNNPNVKCLVQAAVRGQQNRRQRKDEKWKKKLPLNLVRARKSNLIQRLRKLLHLLLLTIAKRNPKRKKKASSQRISILSFIKLLQRQNKPLRKKSNVKI